MDNLHIRGSGSGKGEGLVFHVTRHTPRRVPGGQRRLHTPSEVSPHLNGKRMKLDASSSLTAPTKGEYTCIYRIAGKFGEGFNLAI